MGDGNVDDRVNAVAAMLAALVQHGGTGCTGGSGGDTARGDSTSGESPDLNFDRVVAGRPAPDSADEGGWGDLVNPRALVALINPFVRGKRIAAAADAIVAARDMR